MRLSGIDGLRCADFRANEGVALRSVCRMLGGMALIRREGSGEPALFRALNDV